MEKNNKVRKQYRLRKKTLLACILTAGLVFVIGRACFRAKEDGADVQEGLAGAGISFDLSKKAGVVMTPAGAPFPYGKDPKDSVIRIAPTYPSLQDLETATRIFVVCVKLVSMEKLLAE